MAPKTLLVLAALATALLWREAAAGPVAKVSVIEGTASVLRSGAEQWRDARPGTPLTVGDQLYCREESFVEIRYSIGAIVRMNQNTKIVVEEASEEAVATQNTLGDVWVNLRKFTKQKKSFELASPTAVAAVRGTVFQMTTDQDSSTDVNVFEGMVAVGPTTGLKKKIESRQPRAPEGRPVEVPGPEEIPGPFEVSLDRWRTIVAGQRISVRPDGMFAQEEIDMAAALEEAFVKRNQELDKKLAEE